MILLLLFQKYQVRHNISLESSDEPESSDDSHEIPYLIFSKILKDVEKFVICSRDWRFKGYKIEDLT